MTAAGVQTPVFTWMALTAPAGRASGGSMHRAGQRHCCARPPVNQPQTQQQRQQRLHFQRQRHSAAGELALAGMPPGRRLHQHPARCLRRLQLHWTAHSSLTALRPPA